jgi:hypothetical protein
MAPPYAEKITESPPTIYVYWSLNFLIFSYVAPSKHCNIQLAPSNNIPGSIPSRVSLESRRPTPPLSISPHPPL